MVLPGYFNEDTSLHSSDGIADYYILISSSTVRPAYPCLVLNIAIKSTCLQHGRHTLTHIPKGAILQSQPGIMRQLAYGHVREDREEACRKAA
jgi:hypothetical protein